MNQLKLNLAIATFSYGGNGGFKATHPDVGSWIMKVAMGVKDESRIEHMCHFDVADTPITMTRNMAVQKARKAGADVLIMVDSDMLPDCELKTTHSAKPFFQSSFDFLYDHYPRGPVVIGAPYCGPPPMSNVYVFHWANWNNPRDCSDPDFRLEAYTRAHSVELSGIRECAALPTGLIMYDMRCFDLIPPPYFYYEYTDEYNTEKASTEDVTNTRDISMHGFLKLGYNPVFCNWDAWAGHHKPLMVGKPKVIYADHIAQKYREAVEQKLQSRAKLVVFNGQEGPNGSRQEPRCAAADGAAIEVRP